MNVFIRDKPFADLQHIYEWIRQDRPDAAVGVIDRIFQSLDRLAVFPFMGHPGVVARTYEWVVPGIPFIIVYEIDEPAQELRVIAVFHSSQDREWKKTDKSLFVDLATKIPVAVNSTACSMLIAR